MARYSNVQTDFSGGLISDYILGRTDIKRVANSARVFKNFFPSLQGPAVYRTGFRHYNKLPVTTDAVKSIDLELATDVPYRAVFTPNNVEVFNTQGVSKISLPTDYSAGQINDLRFSSETGELYITHGSHKPKRLSSSAVIETESLASSDGYELLSTAGGGVDTSFAASGGFVDTAFTATHPLFEGRTTSGNWTNDNLIPSITCSGFFKNLRNTHPVKGSVNDVIKTSVRFKWDGVLTNDDKRTFMVTLVDMPRYEASPENVLSYPQFSIATKFTSNQVELLQQLTSSSNTSLGFPYTQSNLQGDELQLDIEVTLGTSYLNTSVDVTFKSITDNTTVTYNIVGVDQTFYASITSGNGVKVSIQSGDVPNTTVNEINVYNISHRNETTFPSSISYQLFGLPTIINDDLWTLSNLDFDVEPFLENEPSSKKYSISQNERVVKLVSSGEFTAIASAPDPTLYYVDYLIEGKRFLGKVLDSNSVSNYTIADPTASTVYVEPVVSVLDIEDNSAQLYLLDNEETITSSGNQLALTRDSVPADEIHVRSDTAIFNAGQAGSWLRIGDDRRNNDVVVGHTRSVVRWVRLKEHYGLSDHPVEFYRGSFVNTVRQQLSSGTVYRLYDTTTSFTNLYAYGPNSDGDLHITTGILQNTGNRTWSNRNGLSSSKVSSTSAFTVWAGADVVIGNLSTQKQFDVFKCYNNTDDSQIAVTEASNLVVTGDVEATEIANDAILNVTQSTFVAEDLDRHCMGLMESGNVFMKIIEFQSNVAVRVKLLNPVPRDKRTLEYENGGTFEDFKLGAWYPGNYPRTVAKFEQRRIFGGTYRNPNFLYFSETANEASFKPTQDDKQVLDTNAITYGLANSTAGIRWLTAGRDLIIGTSGGLYRIVPNQYQFGISPKTVRLELAEEEPCEIQAEVVGTSVFYPDQSGSRIMEYKFDQSINAATSNDVTKLIYPTFLNDPVKQLAYQHTPQPRLWARTRSGNLFCLSYHRQEQFYSWSEQNLGAGSVVVDLNVVHQGAATDLDRLWITVRRPNGSVYTEALTETDALTSEITPMLDSHIIITKVAGSPISNNVSSRFSDGDTVAVVEDGKYIGDQVVASGQVTLNDQANTKVLLVGTRYEGELKMMFPTWDGRNKPSYGSDNARIVSVRMFFVNAFKYILGSVDKFETVSLTSSNTQGFTGFDKERPVTGSTYGVDRVPTIKHNEPYPLTIASITTKTDLN